MGNAIQHSVKAIFKCGYSEIRLHCSKSIMIIIFHPHTKLYIEKNTFL